MIVSLIAIILAYIWLAYETDWFRVRLPVGTIPLPIEIERLGWNVCVSRYGNLKLSCGVSSPICGWEWLKDNTHPIPQVKVDFTSGGVRYHWDIKECGILKDAITATHAKRKNGNGHLNFKKNKLGGIVAPLPAKAH